MSLVITSNIGQDDVESSNVFKPFSYQNHLNNTYKIPANSEIALQSAKINKNSLMVVDRTNSGYCHFYGVPIADGQTIQDTPYQPFFGLAGTGQAFRDGKRTSRNTEDFADDLEKSIAEIAFHPNLVKGDNPLSASINVQPLFESNTFKGYKWTFTQATANTTRTGATIDDGFTDLSEGQTGQFAANAGSVVSTADTNNGFYVQNREYPISQNNGTCVIDFSGANASDTQQSPFIVGLSRVCNQKEIGGVSYFTPSYYNSRVAQNSTHFRRGCTGEIGAFFDICIARAGANLYVYQSTGFGEEFTMSEVVYYGAHNPNFATQYNIRTNGSVYTKVKFQLDGEEMKIFMIASDGGETLLCDYTTMRSTVNGSAAKPAATKNQFINPMNCAKWALYPTLHAIPRGNQKTLTVDSIVHYTSYPSYSDNRYDTYDWFGYVENEGQVPQAIDVDLRAFSNRSSATILAPKNVNASGFMDGYINTLITAKSQQYGDIITAPCNSQQILGFTGRPVSVPSSASGVHPITIESELVPTLSSGASLFVRLNNFTQNSLNARQGSISKIVGHLPRFDNSGNDTGALYFEPHEKTYIDLNNTEEIYVNSFDVDIVYDNETFCTALSGKTIVCFHIRKKLV